MSASSSIKKTTFLYGTEHLEQAILNSFEEWFKCKIVIHRDVINIVFNLTNISAHQVNVSINCDTYHIYTLTKEHFY